MAGNSVSIHTMYGVINPPRPRRTKSGQVASGRVGGAEGKSGAGERDRWLVVMIYRGGGGGGGGDSIVANILLCAELCMEYEYCATANYNSSMTESCYTKLSEMENREK